ncbi:MAG: LysR family transcriptional regulator [Sphingomonadales bacterium]|nr:LysR family transcriptional regulator [Sphingomonadales bacterium]
MDIAFIRTFLAAATTGSFVRAAARVNASPSAVTERIKTLEYQLSARLFNRDKRGCTLTAAGRRFLEPAQAIVRTWDEGRQDIALPPQYTHSIAIGGQFALWPSLLLTWLNDIRTMHRDLAIRATAGTSLRFSRDLADGLIDMAFLYNPVFLKDIVTDELFDDALVLVTADPSLPWTENYFRIHWGEAVDGEIASRLGYFGGTGLVLDLGLMTADWLIDQKGSGYMPRRTISDKVEAGLLTIVEGAPVIPNPSYVCWRRDGDTRLIADLINHAKRLAAV